MTSKPILSSNGVHRLHHHFFIPKGTPIASLLIIHGMSEHSGRYAKFAQFLADNGVLVLTYDLLGHGHTVKDKYELGFFDEKHPMQTLCKDVIIMANALKAKANALLNKEIPCFVMGHSMGSFIVRTVLTHHATSFDGVILMGTGNSFGVLNKVGVGYLALQNQFRPKKTNLPLAGLINHTLLNKLSNPISPSPFAWLSENLDNIRAFETDPLCGFAFTNNGFYTLNLLMKKAINTFWYEHLKSEFGILLISGKDDPVGNMGQDINDLCDELLNANKLVKAYLYPNARHEILHENIKERVYADILTWIKSRL